MLDGLNLDETFTHQVRLLQKEDLSKPKVPKMNFFQTYIAIIKGYCALMILVLPRSF